VFWLIPATTLAGSTLVDILVFPQSSAVSGVELPNVGWAVQDRRVTPHRVAYGREKAASAWAMTL
jgi:hypothetical protein